MCRSSTKEVTCTSPRISKLYMAYEHINEGLPGHHYKNCPQICWGLPCLRKMVLGIERGDSDRGSVTSKIIPPSC